MKRNFIFAFILLATLLMVNAVPTELRKRVTAFEPCPDETPLAITEVVPDPIIGGAKVTFDISGTLPKAITTGSTLGVIFADVSTDTPKLIGSIGPNGPLLVCTPDGVLDCPYAAKTPFSVELYGLAPANLPKSYAILVLLLDANAKALGCARSFVGGAQPVPATPKAPKAPAPPPDAPAPAPSPAPPPGTPSPAPSPAPPPAPPPGTPAPAPAPAATPPPAPASPSPPSASPPPAAPSQGSGAGGIQDFKALIG